MWACRPRTGRCRPTRGRCGSWRARACSAAIELLSLRRYAALAALDGGLSEQEWASAASGYLAEYGELGTGPEARGPALFRVVEDGDVWHLAQILDDPEGDHDWRITADLDLPATDEIGELVLVTTGLGPA